MDEQPADQPSGAGYRVMFDRDGHLWVATYGAGLWRVNVDRTVDKRMIDRAGLRTGLSSDVIQVVLEDRDGNVWVGTSGGLHRLTRRRLTPVEDLGYAIAVEPDAQGGMWVGTTTGLSQFTRDDARRGLGRVVSQGLYVRSVYDDHRGTVWVGANEGLFRLVAGHLAAVALPLRPGTPITSIAPGQNGSVWLTDGNWLFRWNGRRLNRFQPPGELTSTGRVVYAQSDRAGRLWVGFEFGQLGFVSADDTLHLLGPTEGFHASTLDVVHAVFTGDDGDVWIGRSTGLGRFKRGRFIAIGREHGLLGGQVWSVISDSRQRLWLSVDRGLICLDKKEFENAVNDPDYRVQYRLYDTLDGLAGRPFGHISASRANNGTLWFVQGGGLTRVSPEEAREDPSSIVAPLFIESVVTSAQRVASPSQDISFPHGTGRLQINYSAVALSAPNKIRFRYRLVGVDANWIDAGTLRVAFYTNLSPGSYRFQVQASAEEGIWNTSKAELPFTIEPAFYQTRWFYAMWITVALVGVGAIWRFRLGLVKREFSLVLAERTRLSRELHDTLLQSLVGVVLQLEPIAKMIVQEPLVARNQLNRVRRQVEAYVREARESIKNLRSPSLRVRSLSTALEDFGQDAVAHTSATLHVHVSGSAVLPPDIEGELFRIGQEAITNAVRHASAMHIDVSMESTDEFVSLRVTDDGCGFDYDSETVPDDHYGLITMRERAEELHGALTISTMAGKGTVVEVTVPIEQTFRRAIPA
jgi:signal transduction histidine kinase